MIFDRDDDLKNEDRIIDRVCKMWDCESEKLSGFAYADFILLRGMIDGIDQGVAFAEIRCRSVKKDDYDTIFISINKVMNMCKMSELTGLAPLFIVEWSDQAGFINLVDVEPLGTGFPRRRNPRRDASGNSNKDEPVLLLKTSQFTHLWDVNQ